MERLEKVRHTASAFLVLFALSACGSGGSGENEGVGTESNSDSGSDLNTENESVENTEGTTTESDSGGEAGSNGTETTGGGGTTPPVAGLIDSYMGHFVAPCHAPSRSIISQTITEDSLVTVFTSYGDVACTQPTLEQATTYSIIFPGGVTSTDLGDAIHIDQTIESTSFNGEVVNQFGDIPTFYQIMFLDGINLYIGDELANTEADRPTELETEFVFVRQ